MRKEKKKSIYSKTFNNLIKLNFLILLPSLVLLYFITSKIIEIETEEVLFSTTYRVEKLLGVNKKVNSISPIIEIEIVDELRSNSVQEVIIFDESQNEYEDFIEYNKYVSINNIKYRITSRTLVVESDDILLSIIYTFICIIIFMYLTQFIYLKRTQKKIWTPFIENLKILKNFSVKNHQKIKLQKTNIIEFSNLNENLELLTDKVIKDYYNLKQFTEDVSHESQTPIAIIQAKIENLIDESELNKKIDLLELNSLLKNVKRLSKLNKGLILLTKINNNQFNNIQKISINNQIKEQLDNLEDIIINKDLKYSIIEVSDLFIYAENTLIDILISNLINNSIKYTKAKNEISIIINNKMIKISNPSDKKIMNEDKIFNRFYKEQQNENSLGLGLAIVKRICDYYDYEVIYEFKDQMNNFIIKF